MKKFDRKDLLFQISKSEFLGAVKLSPKDEQIFYSLMRQRLNVDNQIKKILSKK
jgi:hypothetical protein